MKIAFKPLVPEAILPNYAFPGDAGMDLKTPFAVTLEPGVITKVPLGLAVEIPEGYVGLVWEKSGLALKGVTVLGGVIDSGYRGELICTLRNVSETPLKLEAGHKVAQLLIQTIVHVEIVSTETLSETDRKQQGFGSTGK